MRVSRRFAVLTLMTLACAPRALEAAPFLLNPAGGPIQGAECTDLVPDVSLSACGLFSIDPFAGPITGGLEFDNDVALFLFVLTSQSNVAAITSGFATTDFDPFMGLFYGADTLIGGTVVPRGTIVEYPDPTGSASIPARSRDISDVNFDDVLPDPDLRPTLLLDPGTYILALLQYDNDFTLDVVGGADMLRAGFSRDDNQTFDGGCVAEGTPCSFTLSMTATPVDPAPVPEPGTLSLLILGSAAAAVVRRRRTNEPRT